MTRGAIDCFVNDLKVREGDCKPLPAVLLIPSGSPLVALRAGVHGGVEPKGGWADTVNAKQLQHETARLGGILLIIGIVLHVVATARKRRVSNDPVYRSLQPIRQH